MLTKREIGRHQHASGARRLPVAEAAIYCGLSISFMNKLRCTGGGPAYLKLGARIVYSTDDLDAWMAASRRTSVEEPRR